MKPKTSWIVCVGCNHDACGAIKLEVGGCSAGKSFRFVRACLRAVWLPSGIGSKIVLVAVLPFPFWSRGAFSFPFCHGGSMEARGGPSLYRPPTLLHCKNNGFCNISYAMEAPWRLVEARLCTSLHRFCIVKTIKKQAFCTIEALRDSGLYLSLIHI